ncbi:MAG: PTS sugar transporter subunit IIA [Kiritimatiellae bacterium]|nr:PTS sugar transporter subunit IIA [Kiritimatiellia bacterium]
MKKTINQLIQLQELMEAMAQQSATSTNGRLDQLKKAIDTYLEALPPDLGEQFIKLQKKHHIAIVPISNGTCTGCGMALPVSRVHAVRAATELHTCPNCARILYFPPKELPKRMAQKTRRFSGPAQAGLSRFSSPNLMLAHSTATSKEEIIAELAALMEKEGFINDSAALTEAALRREAIVSTALDHGLAFPHVRGVEGGGLTVAVATSKNGFKYDADATKLTRIVVFVVIPTAASAFYLKLLAGLAQTFQKKEARDKVLDLKDSDKLWKSMLALTKSTIL